MYLCLFDTIMCKIEMFNEILSLIMKSKASSNNFCSNTREKINMEIHTYYEEDEETKIVVN